MVSCTPGGFLEMQADETSGSEIKSENKSLTRDAKKKNPLSLRSQIRSSLNMLT